MNSASLPALWAQCVNTLKDRVNNRSFWEAIELTHAVTVENDTLIIGLDSLNFNRSSHITTPSVMATITQIVKDIFGSPLQVRLIEGTTLADWESYKTHQARVSAMQRQTNVRKIVETQQNATWDGLAERVTRMYSETPMKMLPQVKARYVTDALYFVVEAMDELYPDAPDELTERGLAKVIDRIAQASDMPAVTVAYELERLRAWRKGSE